MTQNPSFSSNINEQQTENVTSCVG